MAAGPSVSAPVVSRDGGAVTVTGQGFAANTTGIYLGVGPAGLAGFYVGAAQLTDTVWIAVGNTDGTTSSGRTAPLADDGSFTVTVTVPAYVDGAEYALYTSKAHGGGFSDTSQNTTTVLSWQAEPEPEPTETSSPEPTETSSPEPTETSSPEPTETSSPEPTETASPEPTETTPAAPESSLTVSQTAGLDPAGATLTITADDYPATATSKYTAGKAGFYIQVGWLADNWRPSEGAASSSRTNAFSTWVADSANTAAPTTWVDNGDGTADATWTITVDKTALDAKKLAGGTLSVFTVGAGGVVSADSEHSVALTWAEPTLEVSQQQNLDPNGTTLTVTGTDYVAAAASKYTAGKAGVYIQVGWLTENWRPSAGAASSARSNAYSTWVADAANTAAPTKWTDNGDGTADFTWTVTIDKATLEAKKLEGATLAVFTVGAGGVIQAANEQSAELSWVSPTLTVSQTADLDPYEQSLTITGSDYLAAAASKYTAGKAGVYIQVGWLTENWRPSAGAASSARSNAYSTWVADTANTAAPTKWTDNGDGTADFTWTVTIDKKTLQAKKLEGATLAVFTVGAGGVVQAVNELSAAIDFADTARLSVSQTEALSPAGDTITVTAENYPATAASKYTGGKAGFYIQVGWLADAWRPSEGAASSARSNAYSTWVADAVNTAAPTKWVDNGDGTADATWTITIDRATLEAKKLAGGTLSVFTVGAGGVVSAASEQAVAISFVTPELTVSQTEGLDPASAEITVTGTGFEATAASKYTAGKAGVYIQVGWLTDAWRPSEGAASSARSNAYSTWVADAANTAAPTKWVDNGDGTADFTWTVTIDKATLEAKKLDGSTLSVFTVGAGGVVQAINETSVEISFVEPKLTVSKTSGLNPDSATITVTGTGYSTAGKGLYGPTAGQPAGVYAQIGWLAETWQPSKGAASSARTNAYSAWVQGTQTASPYLKWTDNGDGTADFTWTVTIDEATLAAKKLEGGTLSVFTVGAGGVVQAVNEKSVAISFAEEPTTPEPTTQGSLTWGVSTSFVNYITGPIANGTATVSNGATKSANLFTFAQAVEGTTYDAQKGTGDVAYAGAVRFTGHGGALDVTIANPKVTVVSASRADLSVTSGGASVVVATLDLSKATRTTAGDAVTFTAAPATLTAEGLEKVFGGTAPTSGLDAVTFTIGVASVIVTPEVPSTPTTPSKPSTPSTPSTGAGTKTETVADGSLRWAISSSFVNYVTGPIAKGAITVSGGATRSGGQFQFGQATGSTYDAKTGLGTVSYVGAVRFTGHSGVLDVTVANPQVRITSATSATLYVTSGGSQVAFATLNLAQAAKTTSNGAVTYTAAPASLTSAGLSQVFSGYSTSLNPVTFTIGAAAAAPSGSTGTVAAASADDDSDELPATPPATEGIEADDETLAALQSGEQVTISVPGFEPNEEDIKIVVYSTPILLGTVTADADGVATWTGTLPATLEDGEHTLTFQGSIDRGIVFTLDRAGAAALGACTVDDATLNWGFKESFRTYIEGIAAGGWELTDVAYEYPEYVWTGGTGSLDLEASTGLVTYGGAIEFTGHDGALDTTLSDFRLELAGDTGYIVVDVSGTTQEGEDVTAEDVRFAQFELGELTVADGVVELVDLPSTLTDAGAAAFGTYAAGEQLDPVSAEIPVPADCEVVVAAPAEDGVEAAPEQTDAVATSDEGAPIWPWALGGLVLVAAVAAVVAVNVARRRKAAGAEEHTGA
ncbi:hypothetical protein GCM10025738_18550 [Microbacterium fluvii]